MISIVALDNEEVLLELSGMPENQALRLIEALKSGEFKVKAYRQETVELDLEQT